MPRSRDLAIFTPTTVIALPLAHARGVIALLSDRRVHHGQLVYRVARPSFCACVYDEVHPVLYSGTPLFRHPSTVSVKKGCTS